VIDKTVDATSEPHTNARPNGDERQALAWTAIAAIGAVIWLVWPIGMGIFAGMLMGFAFDPLYRRAVTRWPPRVAAVATVAASIILVAIVIGGFVWLLVRDGIALGREAVSSLGSGGHASAVLASMGRITSRVGITSDDLAVRLRTLSEDALKWTTELARVVVTTTAGTLLEAFFCVVTMYFLLIQGDTTRLDAERALPLRPDYTRKLLHELREVGRQTLIGTVGAGMIQGLLATLGYWMGGLPRPLFFGAVTAIVSLVPGVGTVLVWLPAAIVQIASGHVVRGVVLIVWGLLVVTLLNDYVIRPLLLGRRQGLPPLAMFVALFGGIASMGVKGLIVGPVVMSLAFAVLKLYAAEASQRRSPDPG
jgi:predicted PurR-regulated permease PerM